MKIKSIKSLQAKLLGILCAVTVFCNAQTDCKHDVSTDPGNPTNTSLPILLDDYGIVIPGSGDLYLNGFDWLETSGGIYQQYTTDNMFFDGGGVPTPYVMNNIMSTSIPEYNYISASVEPLIENGWELLLVNLGRFPNDTDVIPLGSADNTAFPYIVLYNRYSGIIRVFTNFGNDSDAGQGGNALQITLGFEYPNTQDVSGVLRLYDGVDRALNETTNIVMTSAIVVKPAQGSHWASADFQMSYDPCTCFTTSMLQIGISSFLTSDIKLKGRSVSIEDELTDGSGNINPTVQEFLNGFELTASGEAEDGIIIYKNIQNAIDEYIKKFEDYEDKLAETSEHNEKVERNLLLLKAGKIVVAALSGIGATGTTTKVVKAIGVSGTNIANGLKALKKGYVVISKEGDKLFDTKKVMKAVKTIFGQEGKTFLANNFEVKNKPTAPTMPTVTLSEMAYTGTLTTPASVGAVSFYNPGVYGSTATGTPPLTSYYEYPIYNEVLGNFALLRKPRVRISKTLVETRNDLFHYEGFNWLANLDEVYLTRYQNWEWNYQIQLNEDLKFAINDVPDVKDYSVKAAYVVKAKVKDQNLAWLASDYRYINARQGSENVNIESSNSEVDTLGYPLISGEKPFEYYAPYFYSTLGSPSAAFVVDTTEDLVVAETPFIPIDAFKPFTAGISLMNEGISFKSYEGAVFNPEAHTLSSIPMNSVGYNYDLEIELKLMVDIEFHTLNSDGEHNSTTMLLAYPVTDVYTSPTELVPNLPNSLKNIGQYEKVREFGDIHFDGQEVKGCKKVGTGSGDIYTCYAIEEIIINGDITVANDNKVYMRAGNVINATAESSISPEVHMELYDVYDYSNPMPKVNQQYVNDFCQGVNGQNFAYAANSYVPQVPKNLPLNENTDETQGIKENVQGIHVYPNPVKETLNLRFELGNGSSGEFIVYDVLGNTIHTVKLNKEYKVQTLDVSHLSKGTYLYSFRVGDAQVSNGKFIVQ